MARTRKQVTMLVTVSMPTEVTAVQARREIRYRVKDGCGWSDDTDNSVVKLISLRPARRK